MKKIKNFFQNHWRVVLFFVLTMPFFVSISILAAGTGWTDKTATWGGGFVIDKAVSHNNFTVNGRTVSVGDTSRLPGSLFIPSKTLAELDSFLNSTIGKQVAACVAQHTCDNAYCGDNGCGTNCSCLVSGYTCINNVCTLKCIPSCPKDGSVPEKDSCNDGCGGACGNACENNLICDEKFLVCSPAQ